MSLLDLLRLPAVGSPASLSEQLDLIRRLWRPLLGDSMDRFLLMAGEILREEELAIWMQFNPQAAQAREAAERHRQTGQQQWPSVVSHAEVPVFGDPAHEHGVDAEHGADCQEHVCVAGAVEPAIRAPHRPAG